MNGQTMAQWLVENKNGKEWKKYGKERVYINVYVGGVQVANYFYDIVTDRFFGCDSKTEKIIRNEFEAATKTNTNNDIEKLQKELETRKSMLKTQLKYSTQDIIENTKKRIQELEEAIKAETTTEETTTEEATTEEVAEEVAEEVVEKTKEVTTEAKTEMKETASKISNELQNRFQMEQKEAQTEVKAILKDFTLRIQGDFEKSEIKDMQEDKRLSQFFQLQLLKYIYEELKKWIPNYKMTGGNFGIVEFVKKYDRVDFVTDLIFNRNFEKLIKSIKDFTKKRR